MLGDSPPRLGKRSCEFDTAEPIRIVQRKIFDTALLERYQSIGGEFIRDALMDIEEQDSWIVVTLKSGKRIACAYLVGADGSNSRGLLFQVSQQKG